MPEVDEFGSINSRSSKLTYRHQEVPGCCKARLSFHMLSYIWGNASTLGECRENLESLRKEDSIKSRWMELLPTIKDTIGCVEQLGIPYLWFDALCILQHDTVSKHDQVQAMAGIYANAYVTIIAGNSWDAGHGLQGLQGIPEPRQLSAFLKYDLQENLQAYQSIGIHTDRRSKE